MNTTREGVRLVDGGWLIDKFDREMKMAHLPCFGGILGSVDLLLMLDVEGFMSWWKINWRMYLK